MAVVPDKSSRPGTGAAGAPTGKVRARMWAWAAALVAWLGRAEPVYGIAGPIFERDLRVSGRRRRTFILRFVYLAMLGWFVAMAWLVMVTVPALMTGSSGRYAQEMADAGIVLTEFIIWFQFIALPLLAIIMLSTSISEEVRRRTLGVLMTTPISSADIVLGKFLGKMVQLGLLLAISVPLLAVVRVLGGVTLEFVLAGTCITLTMTMLSGALSELISVGGRAMPLVVLATIGAMLMLFLVAPLVVMFSLGRGPRAAEVISIINPFTALSDVTQAMQTAGVAGYGWVLHCLVMLGLTAAALAMAAVRVRRAAMLQLIGGADGGRHGGAADGRIRPVRGSPVAWRESRGRIYKNRIHGVIGTGLGLVMLCVTYCVVAARGSGATGLDAVSVQAAYVWVLMIYGMLHTAVAAPSAVTAEKESGTWPILLITPLEDFAVVFGKAVGALRSSIAGWIPLAFHMVLFAVLGLIHPVAVPLVLLVALGVALVMAGSGVLAGVVFRRPAAAAAANLAFGFFMWVVLPMMAGMGLGFASLVVGDQAAMLAVILHPLAQVYFVVDGTAGAVAEGHGLGGLRFHVDPELRSDTVGLAAETVLVLMITTAHAGLAWLLCRFAGRRLRKGVM
jgi:ABC-type transport system involved in multi-copper enzyme maturation permease subunit